MWLVGYPAPWAAPRLARGEQDSHVGKAAVCLVELQPGPSQRPRSGWGTSSHA